MQLVSETTTVLLATTALGRSKTVAMDVAAIEEKYGIQPRQLIEVKSLMGDASDNIPGVRGIGEKTALALVQRFGTLENVYANLDDKIIKPKQREHLLECRADAELSHLLGTIRTDAPIDTAEGAYKVGEGNKGAAVRLMQELELHTLIPRFGLDGVTPEAAPEEVPTLEGTVSELPEPPAGHYLVATRPAVMGRAGVKNVVLQPEAWYAVQGSTVYPLSSGELVQLLDAPGVTLDVFDSAPLYALAMAHVVEGDVHREVVLMGRLAVKLHPVVDGNIVPALFLEDEMRVYIAQLLRDAEGQMHTLTGAHRTEGLLEVGVETIEQTRQKGSSFLKKSPGQRCHGALRYLGKIT